MNFNFGTYQRNIPCDDPNKQKVHSWIKFDATYLERKLLKLSWQIGQGFAVLEVLIKMGGSHNNLLYCVKFCAKRLKLSKKM